MDKKLNYGMYKDLVSKYENIVNKIANVRVIMFIVMVISFILKYYYYKVFFNIVFILSLVLFVVMVFLYDKYFKVYDYYVKYLKVLDTYLARENGEWKSFSDKGTDFSSYDKYFLSDLDILGDCSLFQYLSVCKTLGGRRRLMDKLSNLDIDRQELEKNQKLIQELVSDVDFCVKFQVAMNFYDKKGIDLSLDVNKFMDVDKASKEFIIGIVAFVICMFLFIMGILNIIPLAYFYGMFFFNLGISFLYLYIYRDDFIKLDKLVLSYGNLFGVFELVSDYKADSFKLKRIVKDMKNGLDKIYRLKKLEGINSLRNNLLSNFLLNGFGCLNLFIRFNHLSFVNNYFTDLKDSIFDIEELEALVSLATIGIVKNDKCMPVYSDKIGFSFKGLKHPLIDEEVCVSNDFDTKAGVSIITGSNMGGKTTFLRTIGINLILMQAGSYVCCDEMEASYFKIFTSMRVMDNVDKGISTFYGELLRIKDMVDYVDKGNMLVLVDEIFKGTNYNDRMYGAREVVSRLNNDSTVALITTHDFELCDSKGVSNYHVKEDYEGDRIVFDYKIRTGKCTSTNAKYLMKKLDIVN